MSVHVLSGNEVLPDFGCDGEILGCYFHPMIKIPATDDSTRDRKFREAIRKLGESVSDAHSVVTQVLYAFSYLDLARVIHVFCVRGFLYMLPQNDS